MIFLDSCEAIHLGRFPPDIFMFRCCRLNSPFPPMVKMMILTGKGQKFLASFGVKLLLQWSIKTRLQLAVHGGTSCQSSRIPDRFWHLLVGVIPGIIFNPPFNRRSKIRKIPKIPIMNSWAVWGPKSFRTQKKSLCNFYLWGLFNLKKTQVLLPSLMMVCDWGHWRLLVLTLLRPLYQEVGWNSKNSGKLWDFWSLKTCWFFGGVSLDGVQYYFPRQPGFYLCYGHSVPGCQCHWIHCKPTDMDNSPTKFWRKLPTVVVENLFKKSVSIIKFEKRSALDQTIFVQFWTPGKGDEFWKSRFFLRFRIRWRCTVCA